MFKKNLSIERNLNLRNILFLLGIIGLFLLLGLYGFAEIDESDTLFHLKCGEFIWQSHSVPHTDPFSFTAAGKKWVDHEWLFQLFVYLVFKYSGLQGLFYLRTLILFLIFFILFKLGTKKCSPTVVVFALFLLALLMHSRFSIRPELFTLLFLSMYLYIVFAAPKKILLLPLMQILWVNIHGYWVVGPFILFVLVILKFISERFGKKFVGQGLSVSMKELIVILFLVFSVNIFNPYFLKGILYPFHTMISAISNKFVASAYITELKRPITFRNLFLADYTKFKLALIAVIFSFIMNNRSLNPFLFILWLVALCLSLFAERHIAIFGILSYLAFCDNFSSFRNVSRKYIVLHGSRKLIITLMSVGLIWATAIKNFCYGFGDSYIFHQRAYKSTFFGLNQTLFPENAISFINKDLKNPRMFNDFHSGSFLIFSLFPSQKVFIDGRSEFYGQEFINDYIEVLLGNQKIIEKIFSRYGIDCVFLSSTLFDINRGILRYLYFSPDWRLIYFDEFASIFVRKSKKYEAVIEKYAINLENYIPLSHSIESFTLQKKFPYYYLNRAYILNSLELNDAVIKEAELALRITPLCPEAYNLIGVALFRQRQFAKALKNFQFAVSLSPRNAEFHTNLGSCYGMLGSYIRAKEEFLLAIKNDYLFKNAYIYLFKALSVLNDKNGAIKVLRRAERLFPDTQSRPSDSLHQ